MKLKKFSKILIRYIKIKFEENIFNLKWACHNGRERFIAPFAGMITIYHKVIDIDPQASRSRVLINIIKTIFRTKIVRGIQVGTAHNDFLNCSKKHE